MAAKARSSLHPTTDIITIYLIGKHNMATIHISLDPYFKAFEEVIDLCKFDLTKHHPIGLDKRLQQDDWMDWQDSNSKFLQLVQ